jgi:hypothetical protein
MLKVNWKRQKVCTNLTGMILILGCTLVAMKRDGMKMVVSGDLDRIFLTYTPRGQGMAHGEKIARLWKRILFSYLEFEYSRNTILGVSLMVFMRRAQLHLQKLGSDEIGTQWVAMAKLYISPVRILTEGAQL